MGKKNPTQVFTEAVTGAAVNPYREVTRAAGLDGVVDAIDKGKGYSNMSHQMGSDMATGSAKKKKEEAAEGERIAGERQAAAGAEESKRLAAAENARIEGERMGAGSKSRTLLTGPSGLEDEEGGMSRRTLQGRRRA